MKRSTQHITFTITKTQRLVPGPDHKTRLAGVILDLSYREGLPVQRSISASGDFEDLQSLLEAMKQSPAAQASLQKTLDCKEVRPALPPHDN
jgi:hypothetical protein